MKELKKCFTFDSTSLLFVKKIYNVLYLFKKSLACPPLTTSQENKLEMHLTAEPLQLAFNLKTTGEITNRNEKFGLEQNAIHLTHHKYVIDPMNDDLSLILRTKEGKVIITGCAYSGILNICN